MALVPLDGGDLIDTQNRAGYRYRVWHYERGITPCIMIRHWLIEPKESLIMHRINNLPDHPDRWCALATIRYQIYFWFADPRLAFEFKMTFG